MLNIIYQQTARALTNWENHRRQASHNDALTVKFFVVESFNSYFTLFYLGFVKQNLYHLAIQTGSILGTRCAVDQVMEYGLPLLLQRLKVQRRRSTSTTGYTAFRRTGFLTEEELSFEQSTLPQLNDLYIEYAEMCIQYGFLVMFAPVFPVCFLITFVNNIFELRGEAGGASCSTPA